MPQLSKNPLADAIMQAVALRPQPDWTTVSPGTVREGQLQHSLPWNEPKPHVASAETLEIAGPRGPVAVRVYRPRPPEHVTAPSRAIVFAHGGGWVSGNLETHDRACRLIALHAGHPLIAVDYGLAPEVPFPGARDDVMAVIAHLAAGYFGPDIAADGYALCGDSSGAQIVLVAAIAEQAAGRGPLGKALGLLYPALVNAFDSPSHQAYGGGRHGLSTARTQRFWQWHVAGTLDELRPSADLSGMNLNGLPPMHIVAAGLDCVRDDAIGLALSLTHAGQRYVLDHVEEMPHGFLLYSSQLPQSEAMIARVSAFLARQLDV